MTDSIIKCRKQDHEDVCGSTEEMQSCNTIEDSFRSKWSNASADEREDAENVWGLVENKPYEFNGRTIEDICRVRNLHNDPSADHKEISECDTAIKYVLAYQGADDSALLESVWDTHTSQKECKFLDQDYGDGKGRTGRDICKKVQVEKEELLSTNIDLGFMEIIDLGPQVAMDIVNSFGADAVNDIINKSTLTLNPKTLVEQRNECNNKFNVNMGNIIESTCDMDLVALQGAMDVKLTPELIKELTRSSVSNVKQLTNLELVQTCQMETTMKGLLNMQATVDNQALQQAMAESTGDTASANASNTICNNISIDMSPCMYINQANCCNNEMNFEGMNRIKAGCNATVTDIIQEQSARKLQTCNTATDTSLTTDLASKVFNTSGQVAEAESSSTDYTMVIILSLLIGAAALYFYITYMTKYALVGIVFGVIMVILGGLMIGYYFRTRVLKGVSYQQPFSIYSGCTTELAQKMSWGDAKELFETSPIYKAIDFFPDINESDNQTLREGDNEDGTYSSGDKVYVNYKQLPNEWTGTAVFMRDPVRTGEMTPLCTKDEKPCEPKNVILTITKNKTFEEIYTFYGGVALVLVGILITVLSGVMMWESMKEQPRVAEVSALPFPSSVENNQSMFA